MGKKTFTRKDLYDLVWSKSLLSLSKEYQISDNGLRKICLRLNIPLPPKGYWQKPSYIRKRNRAKLPSKYEGRNEVVLTLLNENSHETSFAAQTRIRKEVEANPNLILRVPEKLTKPDVLVAEAKESLNDEKQCFSPYRNIIASRKGILNIKVSRSNISRALKIMDAMIKLLRARGHDIKNQYGKTYALVFGGEIEISIKEKLKLGTNSKIGIKEYSAAGLLACKMEGYPERIWVDGKHLIEDKLSNIIAKLEVIGIERQEYRRKNEEIRKEREEKERIAREAKERKEQEYQRFKELFIQANLMHKANILREYVRTVESDAARCGNKTEDLENWINWAMNKIAWIDPLINQKDLILDDGYKKSLYREIEEGLA
jgi:hypothetical protein